MPPSTTAPGTSAANRPGPSYFAHARLTILVALTLGLVGALFGITFGVATGAVRGIELYLIASCVVFAGGLLIFLAIRPFHQVPWVAPLASAYFYVYLTGGLLLTFTEQTTFQNHIIYLLWFFALMGFNRFVSFGRAQRWLTLLIGATPVVAVGLFAPRILDRLGIEALSVAIVYCLSYLTFSLILSLFSLYREAFLTEHERVKALQRAEALIRQSEERFRRLFSDAATGIGWMTTDGRLLYANQAFCRMLEIDPQRIERYNYASLLLPEDWPDWTAMLDGMRAGTTAERTLEQRMVTAGDRRIWARTSFSHVVEPDGREDTVIFVSQDITEAREMEARLHQSQRLESVGKLTGGVAHDFNNLLTVMIGNAELLERRLAGEDRSRALAEMIRLAAQRGAELTRRLLAFARRQALLPKAVDASALVTGLDGLLRRALGEPIDIRLHLAADLPPAHVDPAQLETALLNLAINARDAMPDGGTLTIETGTATLDEAYAQRHGIAPGRYVTVAVSDTGHGMPEDVQRQAFDPFFTTKAPGEGTGLGLSMVYGFVRQSRGHVTLYSEEGRGTAITLYLPPAGADAVVAPSPEAATPQATGGSERVLLVEDNPLVRDYALSAARSLGYRVVAAEDGVAGLAALERDGPFDLLLTDVVLPGPLNGGELAREARARAPGLKVLFMSGYTANAIGEQGRLDPGTDLLHKPFGVNELARRMRAALDRPLA